MFFFIFYIFTAEGNVIQADGYHIRPRLVMVANNSLPGPPIEVYKGQKVKVIVENLDKGESKN